MRKHKTFRIQPKWARRNKEAYYHNRWDRYTQKAVEKLRSEQEQMELQAAWMRRCVRVPFESFHGPRLDYAEALDRYVGKAIMRFRATGDPEAAAILKTLRIQHGGKGA